VAPETNDTRSFRMPNNPSNWYAVSPAGNKIEKVVAAAVTSRVRQRRGPIACGPVPRQDARLPGLLLLDRPLGGRKCLETVVRDRLAAFDGEPVRAGRESLLGPLDRGELFP
jgi:hypothetical protein